MIASERAFLERLADLAGAAILPHFRTALSVESKGTGRFDPVTAADREAELAMRRLIQETYPAHGVIGEEFPPLRPEADTVWVIDPIDGTRSFIAGLPVWGILVGMMTGGVPRLGMMAQPFTGERFYGDGESADYTGPGGARALRTRPCAALGEAVLFTTSPDLFAAHEIAAYQAVERQVRIARYGCDCYAYCMLAAGCVDVVVEAGLARHDIVPLIPVIEGAGGRVTDWSGGPATGGGQVVASGDPALHDRVLALLGQRLHRAGDEGVEPGPEHLPKRV